MKFLRASILSFTAACALAIAVRAQVQCSLTASAARLLPIGTKLTAKLSVQIDPGWHISSLTTPDGGPERSVITLAKDAPCKFAGRIDAPAPRREHSKAFGVDVETYEREVEFTLPLQATTDIRPGTKLVIEFTYQACSAETCQMPRTERMETMVGRPPEQK